MNKKTLLWVGLVAAGAIVFIALKGYPPAGNGTEGTIGAAKRYQAEQIKSSDVQLGDTSMNDVLQSELFHKMMTNEDFRKLVTSDGFRSAAAEDGFGRMVADADARVVLNAGDVQRAAAPEGDLGKLLASSDASLLVTTADGQRLIAADGFGKFMADASARKTVEDALSHRFAEAGKWAATDAGKQQIEAARAAAIEHSRMTAEAGKVSMDANKAAAEAERRVIEAARRQALDASKLSADADVARLIQRKPELGKMMESDSFKNLASTGKLSAVLTDDGLAKAAASEDVAKIMARPEAARVMAEYGKYLPELGKRGYIPELGRLMTDASFVQAFSDPGFGKSLAAVDGAKLNAMADQMARNAHQ